jgi:hypothetical protein
MVPNGDWLILRSLRSKTCLSPRFFASLPAVNPELLATQKSRNSFLGFGRALCYVRSYRNDRSREFAARRALAAELRRN